MIRVNLRWHRLPVDPVPDFGASKVYVSDLWMYIRAALKVVRKFDAEKAKESAR